MAVPCRVEQLPVGPAEMSVSSWPSIEGQGSYSRIHPPGGHRQLPGPAVGERRLDVSDRRRAFFGTASDDTIEATGLGGARPDGSAACTRHRRVRGDGDRPVPPSVVEPDEAAVVDCFPVRSRDSIS